MRQLQRKSRDIKFFSKTLIKEPHPFDKSTISFPSSEAFSLEKKDICITCLYSIFLFQNRVGCQFFIEYNLIDNFIFELWENNIFFPNSPFHYCYTTEAVKLLKNTYFSGGLCWNFFFTITNTKHTDSIP